MYAGVVLREGESVDNEQQEQDVRQPEATWVPDTYVIIFFVVVLAFIAT